MNIKDISNLLVQEYAGASNKFGAFNTTHEGIAVIREEYLELEAEVFKNGSKEDMMGEAIQLGAMAMRFIYDCCNKGGE